ncbi:MAG TPA: bifunctional UDP-sugar hydrolase/5'-nucleotidase [Terriglobia bacterium]|nr:bifunctional UDP-sugar hydrolase/5'-nucleotidase [Terriglobia bacterium]
MKCVRKLLLCVLLIAGCSAPHGPVHVVVMHTNDIHGQILPKDGAGGLPQIATVIRSANPDLILDAGDMFTGTFLSDEFKGEPTIQAMNLIGYTSSTIGNHEFDYGQDALRMRLRDASFPVLSANLETPISEIKKYTVVTVKGIRFGIIGLTTENVKAKSHPKNMDGVTVVDIVESVKRILPEVRSASDFIICTVHLEDAEEKRFAEAFPEIRLMIGGHNHDALGPYSLGQTLVAKTGVSGRNVGRVDLEFQERNLTKIEAKLIPVTNVPADPAIVKIVEPFETRVRARMAEIVGEATGDLASSKKVESPLANLVADAFREEGKTQIAIENTGGIRARLTKGPVSWGAVFEVLPFANTLVTLRLTGAQLKKSFINGLKPEVGLPAVSGVRIRFDRQKKGAEQLVSLTLSDGTPIEDEKFYSVTTHDFLIAGGDGYTELAKGADIRDTNIFLRDVLIDYIKAHRVVIPATDGRITFE